MRTFNRAVAALAVSIAIVFSGLVLAAPASATIIAAGPTLPETGPDPFAPLLFSGFALISGLALALGARRRVTRGE